MDTKDTRQTYKQYKERQKRIAIKKSYDDKLEQSSNKIEDLYVQLEQIKAALNNQIETRQQIRNEMHREMLRQYNKDNTIEETIELAEKTTCSRDSIREIQNACSTGINVSTVDLDTIDKLIDIVYKLQFIFKEFKSISEIDINPIFCDDEESIVIDAKFYL